ncbi:MAG: hypothetical protein K0S07_584 [Chlamydiales bacterium]|jgi:purine-binding chemotaxis protein CheW|nr:hypothetical protein [Chlamydiales bacterium]
MVEIQKKKVGVEELCLFWLGEHVCGLDVKEVQEISTQTHITHVHKAPEAIRGVANLRGNIVTVVDLRKIFHLPKKADQSIFQILIVEDNKEKVGILVDEVDSVIRVEPERLDTNLNGVASFQNTEFFYGVYKRKENLVTLLDLKKVLAASSPSAP